MFELVIKIPQTLNNSETEWLYGHKYIYISMLCSFKF